MEGYDEIDRVRMERTPNRSPLSRPNNVELVDLDVRQRERETFQKSEYYHDDAANRSYYKNTRQRKHGEINSYMNSPGHTTQGERSRLATYSYYDEGNPSYNERMRFRDHGLSSRVQILERNRVELIRKLDELKDQLTQPQNAEEKPKGRMFSLEPHDTYGRHQNAYLHREGLPHSHGVHKKQYAVDDLKSQNLRHLPEHIGRHVGIRDSYSPRDSARESRGYAPRHVPRHDDISGYDKDIDYNCLRLHAHKSYEVTCTCAYCCDRSLDKPSKMDRSEPYNPESRHNRHHSLQISQDYTAGVSDSLSPTLVLNEKYYDKDGFQNNHHRKAGVVHRRGRVCHPVSGGAPFITCCTCFELLKLPTRHLSVAKKLQIKCGSCFSITVVELGSEGCSTIVSALVDPISADTNHDSKSLNIIAKHDDGETNSFPTKEKSKPIVSWKLLDPPSSTSTVSANELQTVMDKKPNYNDDDNQIDPVDEYGDGTDKKIDYDESNLHPDPHSATLSVSVGEHSKNNFEQPAKQPHPYSATASSSIDYTSDKKLNSIDSEKQVKPLSSSSVIPLDLRNIDKESNHTESEKQLDPLSGTLNNSVNEHSNCAKPQMLDPHSSPLSVSEIEGNTLIGTSVKDENESRQSIPVFDHMTAVLNPQNDAISQTETNLSVNKLVVSCESDYSDETSEEDSEETSEDHSEINVGGGPSFSKANNNTSSQELIKNTQSSEIEEPNVFVNGHLIPYHDVKNAEKLAGPIQPGEYWYDYRAGFWGVMGHPCLGIVMPNIEEFNFPLPKDAAGGNTRVFVNGRELHRADLNILVSRGLPFSEYGSYIIDMSGKVLDEHSWKEVVNLGKLAPTVELKRCGFGMRTP